MVRTKRVYEPSSRSDGLRVLVDRLWPRGVAKETARIDLWLKDVAPSPGLREWFGHRPERFREFAERYRRELSRSPAREAVAEIALRAAHGAVTLLYAARDEVHNNAVVLKEEIDDALGHGDAAP
ncbi:MAG TPA: DUF488 domain-containing protein [Anaeromyxobacteraceae bacterium]|nr:DUF488 domain-containing protein [Anaeromyxobacteraceae bacterium]